MTKFIDLTGLTYGKLLVIERGKQVGTNTGWLCRCSCGNIRNVAADKLKAGHTKTCGCSRKEKTRLIDLTGKTFGKLKVIELTDKVDKATRWLCKCDCGNKVKIRADKLVSGWSKSCGCISLKYGAPMRKAPEYKIWHGILQRCENKKSKKYIDYGGRGIKVCERWKNFSLFLEDMGVRPSLKLSIERLNNDGNYEPGNCIWADIFTQSRNRRNNRLIEFQGVNLTFIEWAEKTGIPRYAISYRVKAGWPLDIALSKPVHKYTKKLPITLSGIS